MFGQRQAFGLSIAPYCTGPGGIWVMAPDGRRIGVIRWPEQAVNFAFGGPDLKTRFCCAR
jgi:gluconolactonase